jgi:uncharacterized protein (TIGR02001 family)
MKIQTLPSYICTTAQALIISVCLNLAPAVLEAGATYGILGKLTSNYVYQGYSKSSDKPAIQGNIDVMYSPGIFAGAWISQVDFNDARENSEASVELSPYVGWRHSTSDIWSFDIGLLGYIYDGEVNGREANYGELTGRLYFRDLLTGQIAISHDAFGTDNTIYDFELLGRFPLTDVLDASASVGYSHASRVFEYNNLFWSIGATWFLHRYAAIDLRYYASRHVGSEPEEAAESEYVELPDIENHFVVSISIGY